jgi:FdhD protein
MDPTRTIDVTRLRDGAAEGERDVVAVEEPLEIRVAGETLAVTMRTPGHDRELVLGFLHGEGVIRSADDVSSIAHCGRVGAEERENVVEVTLAPGVAPPFADADAPGFARRGTITTSACGVCGRRSIDDLLARCGPLPEGATTSREAIAKAVARLRDTQPVFAATGGCHAASLATLEGEHVATFEDVGRHNAVDKVVGAQVRARSLPFSRGMLIVSGRSSFEIVQKAVAAGVPVVASVSAPSSLAVDLARRANVALLGFVRGEGMTVYATRSRVV